MRLKKISKTNKLLCLLMIVGLLSFVLFNIPTIAEENDESIDTSIVSSDPVDLEIINNDEQIIGEEIIQNCDINNTNSSDNPPANYETQDSEYIAPQKIQKTVDMNRVLLVQTSLPWSSDANQQVLASLNIDYTLIGIDQLASTDLTNYQMVIISNDQTQSFYNKYAEVKTQLEAHVQAGGILVIGTCDQGWAGGRWTTTLPGDVGMETTFEAYNIVTDTNHPIVTGQLTDNQTLVDADLYSNWASHRSIDEASLPLGSRIILRGQNTNKPTLVEYSLGKGKIIASGLTWEHSWKYHLGGDGYGTYARKALDDLYVYAMSNAGFSDYTSAVNLSITPNSVCQNDEFTINFNIVPFEGKRDFYIYIYGEGLDRLWWDGIKWTTTLTPVGRYANDQIQSFPIKWKANLPLGIYTIGSALLVQGTAMSPRPEYEASFIINQVVDEDVEIGKKIGLEYEHDWVVFNIGPVMDTVNVAEAAPYYKGQVLHLQAVASDQDDLQEKLFYFWKTENGTIKGSNINRFQTVEWTLPTSPGTYEITAFVGDGRGKIAAETVSIEIN